MVNADDQQLCTRHGQRSGPDGMNKRLEHAIVTRYELSSMNLQDRK